MLNSHWRDRGKVYNCRIGQRVHRPTPATPSSTIASVPGTMGALSVTSIVGMAASTIPWYMAALCAAALVALVLGVAYAVALQRRRGTARAAFQASGDVEAPASQHEEEELERALRRSLEESRPDERWESVADAAAASLADAPRHRDPYCVEETKGGGFEDDGAPGEVHSPLVAPSEIEMRLAGRRS